RREDIPELAEHFLRLASVENDVKPKRLSPRAAALLSQSPWQGNVRELRTLMERLVVLVAKDVVGQQEVMDVLQMPGVRAEETNPLPLRQARARFERQYILFRLTANRGKLGNTDTGRGM